METNELKKELKERIKDIGEHLNQDEKKILKEYLAFVEKVEKEIDRIEIYKGLLSKVEVWKLNNDVLCDEIEDRIKKELKERIFK